MRLSVDTLGTFYEMARQGAGLAADRLTRITGAEARVSATRLEFSTPGAVRAELADDETHAGASVELSGGVEGTTILLFGEEPGRELARTLVTDVAEPSDQLLESAIAEVCGIMNNGFVDGWADVLRTEIDISAPEYVAGARLEDLVAGHADDGVALLFRSRIETRGAEVEFEHYFVPAEDSAEELFSSPEGVAYENLAGFDRVAQRGADRVSRDLTQLSGMETTVDVRRVSFVALDAIPGAVPKDELASVAFSFDGMPSGYLLFLYDRYSARKLVETMVGEAPEEGLGDLGRDALQEASNIMASGLLDGWANVLETSIDHSTPAFTWDMGPAAVDPLIVGLADDQEFAFVFDTRIEAADAAFDVDVYVIPDERDLERALEAVDLDRVDSATANADDDVDVGGLGEDDLADVEEVLE
jgi:chemotaxis protein CheC